MTTLSTPAVVTVADVAALVDQRVRDTALRSVAEEEAIRFTDPGETAALLLGDGWTVYAEREVDLPREYKGDAEVCQWQTILLSHDSGVMLALSIATYDDNRYGRKRKMYDWRGLTPVQRANSVLASLNRTFVGVGLDGLLAALANGVEHRRHGNDPTNWIDAARIILAADHTPEEREAIDAALFLARLSCPRFIDLLAATSPR